MKNVGKSCQDLVIQAQKEGISISVLLNLIQNEWKRNDCSIEKNPEKKEKNNMTEREKMLEEKLIRLNETMEILMSDIREEYAKRIEKLKEESSNAIESAETEEEIRKVINNFYTEARKLDAEQIREEQKLKNEIIKKLLEK